MDPYRPAPLTPPGWLGTRPGAQRRRPPPLNPHQPIRTRAVAIRVTAPIITHTAAHHTEPSIARESVSGLAHAYEKIRRLSEQDQLIVYAERVRYQPARHHLDLVATAMGRTPPMTPVDFREGRPVDRRSNLWILGQFGR